MSDRHIDIDDLNNNPAPAMGGATFSTSDAPKMNADEDIDWEEVGRERASFNPFRSFGGRGFNLGANPLEEVLPREARQHFRASQREFLLGWRSLIDRAISRIDNRDERDEEIRPATSGTNPNKIVIEEIDI